MIETKESIIEDFRAIYRRRGFLTSDRPGMGNIMSNGSFERINLEVIADDYIEDELAAGNMVEEIHDGQTVYRVVV